MTVRFLRLLALALLGCADLQPIEPGVCGNLIIEDGEQCDGDDAAGLCRTPLQPDPCHYDCATQSCPGNLVCGTGLVCRTPNVCGNGVTEPDAKEDCDGESPLGVCRPPDQPGACHFDCTTANCPAGFECNEVGLCTDEGVCGNGIVDDGEDCDGAETLPDAACRPPGSSNECRFDCSDREDQCPVGFGCGVDGVCRAPNGTFVIGEPQLGETLGLALGDFDDDDKGELVHVTIDGFHIRQLSSLSLSSVAVIPTVPAPPVVGDIDEDGDDDLAFRIPSKFVSGAGELAVFLSDGEGRLAPLAQYTENLPGFGVAVDVLPPSVNADLVFVNQFQAHGYSFEADVAAATPSVTFGLTSLLQTGFPEPSSQLLGVAVADFRRNSLAPCDELAIAWRNVGSVVVITPCVIQSSPQVPPWNTQSIQPTIVLFPGGHVAWPASSAPNPGSVFAGDVNGDGASDLIVPTDAPPPPCTLVGCTAPDIANCECHGCNNNGVCDSIEDCVCEDCAGDLGCNYPGIKCDVDGQCEPGSEGCGCPDCAAHDACPGPKSLQVSYGVGDGSFHSSLPVPLGSGDNKTSSLVYDRLPNFQCPDQRGPLASELLAVADLNEDGLADLVTGHGIYVTLPTGALAYTFCPQDDWDEAVVADLDGNSTLDVFAKSGTTTLQYLSGVGDGTFSAQAIAAGGFPFGLLAADVDGDTLSDVAFLRSDVPSPSTGLRDVMVAYGRPFAAPSAPEVTGRARDATRLLAGRMLFGDGAAELVVQRPGGGANTAVMRGGIARQLAAPLTLRSGTALPSFATHEQVTSLEALVYGKFRADHSAQFVFAAMSARFGADHRVELISSEDGEQLVHWHSTPFHCQAPAGPCPAWRLGAIDLDHDEVDSVVAFRNGEVVVFTESTAPQVDQRFDSGFDLFPGTRGEVHSAMVGKPIVADIDADGFEDVAILGAFGSVHILWGDESATLSMDRYTSVTGTFAAFTLLQSDGDQRLELATVSAEGIDVRTLDGREYGSPVPVSDAPSGDILIAGDYSGDGVDDLVVGDELSFTLLFGESVEP